jgi:hypothetical protein
MGPISRWSDTLMGGGPDGGRVEVDADELRLRMADFKVDVPRASVQAVARSSFRTKGTIGVHSKGGRWLANGSARRSGGDHDRPARLHPALPFQPVPADEGQRPDREPRRPCRLHRRIGALAPSSASGGPAGYAIDSFRWGPVA